MASLTLTPTEANVGQLVAVVGDDFAQSTKVTIKVVAPSNNGGFESDITADAAGQVSSTDTADQAIALLTSNGTDVSVNDTVTIGSLTYTFKAAPTTVAREVKIGGTAALSLANLKKAINLTGISGTDYGSATVIHPDVRAGDITATTLQLIAKVGGTAGNSLASTKVAATLSFGGATFSGGAAAGSIGTFRFAPTVPGLWRISATDGTDTATASLRVWAGV